MALQMTSYALEAMLTAALGSGGILHSVQVGLYTTDLALSPNLHLTDMVEPVYGGYTRQAVTWLSPWVDAIGDAEVTTQLVQFQPSDSSASSLCYGAFVVSAHSGGNLISIERFDNPVTLASPGDSVEYACKFALEAELDYGDGLVVD